MDHLGNNSCGYCTHLHLSVDFSKHEIHGPDNGDDIRNEVMSHHEIGAGEMGEARGADTAPIWPIGTVRNQINGHFSFGCFDGCVRLSWGHGKSLGKDLEMVNE